MNKSIFIILLIIGIIGIYYSLNNVKHDHNFINVSEKQQQLSVSDINIEVVKTSANINGVNYPDFSISFYGVPVTYTDIVGSTSVIIPNQNFTYIFFSVDKVIYGVKYDHYGNLIWSKIYNLSQSSINGYINRLYGELKNNNIILLFEDDAGLDYSFTVVPDDGSILDMKLRTITVNNQTLHNDIWTFNQNGTLFQSYGRYFSVDLTNYTMITINYPYVSLLKNGMVLIINDQNKVTNGGYDYQILVVDPKTGLVRKSYFFGSTNDDYLWNWTDFIPKIFYGYTYTYIKPPLYTHYNQDVLPGIIQDDNYVYVIVKDGIRDFLGFDLMKVSRDDGSIVWIKRYILPDLVHYVGTYPVGHTFRVQYNRLVELNNIVVSGQDTQIELLSIRDLGNKIEIRLRENNFFLGKPSQLMEVPIPLMDTIRSVYIILRINKDDGSISYSSDPKDFYNHGAIAVFDRSNSLGFSYITNVQIDENNNIYVTSIVKYNDKNGGYSAESLNNIFDGMRTTCSAITHDTEQVPENFVKEVDCSYYKFYQVTSSDYLNFGLDIVKLYANDNPNAGNVIVIQSVNITSVS